MNMLTRALEPAETTVKFLLTAAEAYPELERAFLDAEHDIIAGFRIFDLSTKLRSDEGKAVGSTWFDLMVHTLDRGVAVSMMLSDFDPVLAADLHVASWQARRAFAGVREAAKPGAKLIVTNAVHGAKVGILPRLLLWPRLYMELRNLASYLNNREPFVKGHMLDCRPGLRRYLSEKPDGRLKAKLWPIPSLVPATHHQKIAVFDRKILCIGGLDLDERRYDDKGHHRRKDETWHDVQLMYTGPAVAQAYLHLTGFLETIEGGEPDGPPPKHPFVRTLSQRRRFSAPFLSPRRVDQSIADAHHTAIKRAKHLIYLETQFFRNKKLAQALAQAARDNPHLSLILIVPAAPETIAFQHDWSADARFGEYLQAKCMDIIMEAFGERCSICSPVRPVLEDTDGRDTLHRSPIIYVHAKVSLFDDETAIVSSANLNGRSLYWDTEAGVVLTDSADVMTLRKRCFDHWLGADADADLFELDTAAHHWRARAQANAAAQPEQRRGFIVPHKVDPARRTGRMLPGVPDEMV